jgi:hypothetical protein
MSSTPTSTAGTLQYTSVMGASHRKCRPPLCRSPSAVVCDIRHTPVSPSHAPLSSETPCCAVLWCVVAVLIFVSESSRGRPKMYAAQWGGLADGASAEGVPFGGISKSVMRVVGAHVTQLPPDSYLKSLSRYGCGGAALGVQGSGWLWWGCTGQGCRGGDFRGKFGAKQGWCSSILWSSA